MKKKEINYGREYLERIASLKNKTILGGIAAVSAIMIIVIIKVLFSK